MKKKKRSLCMKMPKKYDVILHACVLLLVLVGTLMILSTSVGKAEENQLSVVNVFVKQSVFVIVAYIGMVQIANRFSFEKFQIYALPIGVFLILLCVATLFFEEVWGTRAWIRIGSITIQPTEFVKIFMVALIALQVNLVGKRNCDWWSMVKIPFIFLLSFIVLVILQKDLGTLSIIIMLCFSVALIPGHKCLRNIQKKMKVLFMVCVILGVFLMSNFGVNFLKNNLPSSIGHVAQRFSNALDPFSDPYGDGYQPIQGLVAIASGGLKGKGWGLSQQKFGFLTQADNDFILAIVIEELGLGGLLFIVLLYVIVLGRLYYYALKCKDEGNKIILVGIATYIFLHFFLNVGGVGALIPLTGVPLLFISSGGSSLIAVMMGIGMAQSVISKINKKQE